MSTLETDRPGNEFLRHAGRILNAGQTRSLLLTGNIYDLFEEESGEEYSPLLDFLAAEWSVDRLILLVYEINGPIRFVRESDRGVLRKAWARWRGGLDDDDFAIKRMLAPREAESVDQDGGRDFDSGLAKAIGNPTVALEFLRQLCLCSRAPDGRKGVLEQHLLILIEAADLILPPGAIASLSDADRRRVSICHDWFSDPGFVNGGDSVVLIAESRSQLNERITRLPHVLEVRVPAPDESSRRRFIQWFVERNRGEGPLPIEGSPERLAADTAGLTLQALQQLLKGAAHRRSALTREQVLGQVEAHIQRELGDDLVEFKKPGHGLDDVVGFSRLKAFLREEFIPRVQSMGEDTLTGAAVCGPIGSGKTFIFEAVAAELDMVVLVLKNIRSQWFGQTDVLFERLRRVLEALSKVVVFVDEADTMFGGLGPEVHETERRLTGRVQGMMSDPTLRGRVIWLLMTARIDRLSPDLRRPGRAGDLIIPVLDPEGDDRRAFLEWMLAPVLDREPSVAEVERLEMATRGESVAAYAAMRSELLAKSRRVGFPLSMDDVIATVEDLLTPAIDATRRYQTLQAKLNCTRRSLLPGGEGDDGVRRQWLEEIRELEARGIR